MALQCNYSLSAYGINGTKLFYPIVEPLPETRNRQQAIL